MIPRKTSAVISFKRIEELPRELPALPPEVSERFPQMADWNSRWSKWWFDFRTILQELDLSDLLKATTSELAAFKASTTASLDALQQQLTKHAEDIANLQTEVGAIDLSGILAAIAALQALIDSLTIQVSNLDITVSNHTIQISSLTALINSLILPKYKQFLIAASSWPWNHGLGFRPMVEVYDSNWVKMLAYTVNTDDNNLTVTHGYTATGWLVIR